MATRATPKKLVLLPPKQKPKVLRKRTGRARGRPPADLDVKTAARVAGLGATIDEIAAVLGCGHALIYKRMNSDPVFREAIEEGRAFGARAPHDAMANRPGRQCHHADLAR